ATESRRKRADTGKRGCRLSCERCGAYRYRGLVPSRKAQAERSGARRERAGLPQNFRQQRNGTAGTTTGRTRPSKRIEIPKKVTETSQKSGRTKEVSKTTARTATRLAQGCNV